MVLTSALGMLQFMQPGTQDTDPIDRAHTFLTTNLLLALAILVSYKQFGGGKPMECMVPDIFTSAWEDYAENYCWAQDTYFLPWDEDVAALKVAEREEKNISYYQWVPFFLLIEAACFRLPSLIWKYLAGHSGIKIHDIVKLALDEKNVEPEAKKSNVRALTIHLQNALRFHRRLYKKNIRPHRILRFLNLPYSAVFVTTMYLVTKLLYLINVCLQLYFMNKFLETEAYTWYGFSAFRDLMNGSTWEHSGVFPRVTICDFQVRVMGNIQRYSVQCVLVINIFNEKIFIFLWFWYTILMVLTALSFFYWLGVTVVPCFSRWFITRHMELSEMPFDTKDKDNQKLVERFVSSYLKADGIFVLRMITMHSGIIFGTDLILSLWRAFYGLESMRQRAESGELKPFTADILTPTPTANGDDNKLNFLRNRQRWGFNNKKDDPGSEKGYGDEKDDDDAQDDLTKKLIPPRDGKIPTAPIVLSSGLDEPDFHQHLTLEMGERRPSLSERRGSDLHVTIPEVTTAPSTAPVSATASRFPHSPGGTTYNTARSARTDVGRSRLDGVGESPRRKAPSPSSSSSSSQRESPGEARRTEPRPRDEPRFV